MISRLLRGEEAYIRAWQERAARIKTELPEKIRRREPVSRNVEALHRERLSFGERLSDKLADAAGSWRFISGFGIVLGVWVFLNSVALIHHWDKYPYILLNLFLSMLAAVQAPVIMMSQNRQESRDRLRSEHDYEINLKAELEIQQLRDKLEQLADKQWRELLALQSEQIGLLNQQIGLLRGGSSQPSGAGGA
jgi:uncharacterized membrane protein